MRGGGAMDPGISFNKVPLGTKNNTLSRLEREVRDFRYKLETIMRDFIRYYEITEIKLGLHYYTSTDTFVTYFTLFFEVVNWEDPNPFIKKSTYTTFSRVVIIRAMMNELNISGVVMDTQSADDHVREDYGMLVESLEDSFSIPLERLHTEPTRRMTLTPTKTNTS
jgi:hypothetical protein